MGHRKEVYLPRGKSDKFRSKFKQSILDGNYEDAVQISLSQVTTNGTADALAISLIATAEALHSARETNWTSAIESYVQRGISKAEERKQVSLNFYRKELVFELVSKSLRKEYKIRRLET